MISLNFLQAAFDLGDNKEDHKHEIMKDVGKKWREFKTKLTAKYINPYLKDPNLLVENPQGLYTRPEEYPQIHETQWLNFVKSRMTSEFQVISYFIYTYTFIE